MPASAPPRLRARCRAASSFVLALCVMTCRAPAAFAQDLVEPSADLPSASEEPASDELADEALHPPVPEHPIEPLYPSEARAEGAEGLVILLLAIDASGLVEDCSVDTSSGRGDLDESACAAARLTPFTPARRGDTPSASRIRYGVRFTLPERPVEVTSEQDDAREPIVDALEAEVAPEDEVLTVTAVAEAPRTMELRRSAEAVHVVELEEASRQSADMGEVLARQRGIGVRRSGGLGSTVRFSLNGLTDTQIRFFVDGIPLDWMGFPFGIGDVPVDLVDHVEVYRGVVPIRFGADALGGAVNLSSRDPAYAPKASFSYQGGSFGTHRLTLGAGHLFARSGAYVRARAFVDRAENDYPVRVTLSEPNGAQHEGRVRRLHDGYAAQGASLELGFTDVPFADRLSLRLYFTDYTRDVQHNVTMNVPYGEVQYGERSGGAVLRYDDAWKRGSLSAVLAYNHTRSWYTDVSTCTYDWYRRCVIELGAGEVGREPTDQRRYAHAGLARVTGEYRLSDAVTLRASLSPTLSTRAGEELADGPDVLDQVDMRGDFFAMVAGAELEVTAWDERVQAVAFAKYYLQAMWTAIIPEPQVTEPVHDLSRRPGFGGAVRLLLREDIYLKASYEWATRLLRADEVFGDGALIHPNLELVPELGHNVNVGVTVEGRETRWGVLRGDLNLFLRRPEQLVVLLGQNEFFQYRNVSRARSVGFELATGWTSPGDYVSLDANLTYQDFRNVSSAGIFGAYEGDRIPNRPFLFANATAGGQLADVFHTGDRLTLDYYLRYVYEFFRNWETVGSSRPDEKQTIDTQLLHTAAVTYLVRSEGRRLSTSLALHNITNARAFDTYGVQLPGRAVYFKVAGEL